MLKLLIFLIIYNFNVKSIKVDNKIIILTKKHPVIFSII